MLQRPVFRVGDVADPQQLLDFFPAVVADRNVAVFFVDHIVPGHDFGLARLGIYFFSLFELGDNAIHLVVLVRGLFARARNDERRAGFVDEDGIDFVDDGKVVHALHAIMQVELHVVAQIVETEFVVGAVCHVRCVGGAALLVIKVVDDDANTKAEKTVELSHPFRVALGQVIVDRNHVHAASTQRVQIHRERGDQRFALTGLHFGDLAFVQNHAADQLHVEVPHVEHAPSSFADNGKRFVKQLVENALEQLAALRFDFLLPVGICLRLVDDRAETLLNTGAKLRRLAPELLVGELLYLRLKRVDSLHTRLQALDLALVLRPENLAQQCVDQNRNPSEDTRPKV